MSNITNVHYQPGRYVGGDMYEIKQKKDNNDQPRFYAPTHKRAGEPMMECYFGLAIPKAANQTAAALAAMGMPGFTCGWAIKPANWEQMYPGVPYWGEVIWLEAHNDPFFAGLVNPQTRRIDTPTFAWKIDDGDDPTPRGERQIPLNKREGHAGCWIINLKSGGLPKFYDDNSSPLLDKGAIKRGWWVEVYGSVQGNGQKAKPGVYLNHQMVSYRAPDKEISYGPDVKAAGFGKFALPMGVSAQPLGPTTNFPAAQGPGGLPTNQGPGALPVAGLPAQGAAIATAQGGFPAGAPAGLPGSFPGVQGGGQNPLATGNGAGVVPGLGGVSALPGTGTGNALPVTTSPSNGAPTAVQQHPGFLQPQVGLQPAGLPVTPVVAVTPVLHPQLVSQGHTWVSLQAQGITLDHAKSQGWIVG